MAFDPTHIGAEFRYNDGVVAIPVAGSAQIVTSNPYRVWVSFQVMTASMFLRPVGIAANGTGYSMLNGSVPLFFSLHDSGPLCQQQWTGFSAAGTTVYFVEVLFQPPGGS